MKSTLSTAVLLPLILMQTVTTPPPVQDVVTAVSRNAQEFRNQLPDFVCAEKVTSTTLEAGNIQKQKIVDSLFSVRKSREQREILAIDGKPAKKDAKMPDLPLDIGGAILASSR